MDKQEMKDIVYPLTAEEFNQPQKVTSQEVWDVINEADVEVEQSGWEDLGWSSQFFLIGGDNK